MSNTVELEDGLHWIFDCHRQNGSHQHHSQYLIHSGEYNYLVDAGAEPIDNFKRSIIDIIGEEGSIDFLLLTHSILPHTKNVGWVQETWPDVETISASPLPEVTGVPNAKPKKLNTMETLGDMEFVFLSPLLTDAIVSTWIYNTEYQILFTAEGLGHLHKPGNCSGISDKISLERIHEFNTNKLPFLRYIDPEKLESATLSLQEELDIEILAPMHGNPILGSNIQTYFSDLVRSARRFEA